MFFCLCSECAERVHINADTDQVFNIDFSGEYKLQELQGARPTYKHETHNLYLFYKSWWKVDTEEAFSKEEETTGFISAHDVAYCPEAIPAGSWQYYNKLAYQSQIVVTQGKHISIGKIK